VRVGRRFIGGIPISRNTFFHKKCIFLAHPFAGQFRHPYMGDFEAGDQPPRTMTTLGPAATT
ncbi:hypothetical protein, partial [Azospirillum griseum]